LGDNHNIDGKIKITYNQIKNRKGGISYEKYSKEGSKGQEPILIERAVNTTERKPLQRKVNNENIGQIRRGERNGNVNTTGTESLQRYVSDKNIEEFKEKEIPKEVQQIKISNFLPSKSTSAIVNPE